MTDLELLHNCIFILNAGHETTTNLIGNGVDLLVRNPDAMRELREHPELIETAVEEFLRVESSNQLGNRRAAKDTTLGGVAMPQGTYIHIGIGAANRDPAQFPNLTVSTFGGIRIGTSPSWHGHPRLRGNVAGSDGSSGCHRSVGAAFRKHRAEGDCPRRPRSLPRVSSGTRSALVARVRSAAGQCAGVVAEAAKAKGQPVSVETSQARAGRRGYRLSSPSCGRSADWPLGTLSGRSAFTTATRCGSVSPRQSI